MKLNILGDEEIERLRTFGLQGSPIPALHVEAIAKATVKGIVEMIEKGKWAPSIHNKESTSGSECPMCQWQELKNEVKK